MEKRIRRHVVGRPHPFFAVAAPGLEADCAAELAALLPEGRPHPVAGGVVFTARLEDAWRANLTVRTAGRILMRIAEVRAVHFDGLEKALAAVAWELYLGRDTPVEPRVTVRKSRLHHSGAVAERLLRAVEARRAKEAFRPAPGAAPQVVHLRGRYDRFTVSLDTSGEALHKRGLKTDVGAAPLRETLAAAVLRRTGYRGEEVLLDPMCGAGTFSLEAALIACRVPPGWHRRFAFMDWPSFRPRRWEHLRRTCGGAIRRPPPMPIVAADRDPAAGERLAAALGRGGLAGDVAFHCRDFFDLDPRALAPAPGVVVLNPPYGRRLGGPNDSRTLFGAIGRRLAERYAGWRVAVVAPPGFETAMPEALAPTPVVHGGLRLSLWTGRIGV